MSVFRGLEKLEAGFPDIGSNRSKGEPLPTGRYFASSKIIYRFALRGRPRRSAVPPGLACVWACGFCPADFDETGSWATEENTLPPAGEPGSEPASETAGRNSGCLSEATASSGGEETSQG